MNIYKYIFLIASISYMTSAKSQIIRGPTENEFFLNCEWYFDLSCTHYALFYSNDHGQTIEVNYEYGGFPESPPSLGEIFDDAQPGVLYNKPFYYSDFMISSDYGISWEALEVLPIIGDFCGGSVPGEIYHYGFSSEGYLLRSIDYAQSFDTINTNVKYGFSVGVNPEILYGITNNYSDPNQYFLNISHDNGLTFDECLALDTSITGRSLKDIYRGANPGELYLVSRWLSDHYNIYFSTDDGHTWQFRYSTIDVAYWTFSFTPGSGSGTFYIARMNMDPTETHTWLYIDYSSDTAHSFTSYFHDLTLDVGIPQKGGQANVENIQCYPNPANEMVCVGNLATFSSHGSNIILEIYNIFGEKMDEVKLLRGENDARINTSTYTPGFYMAIVRKGKDIISTGKFLIVR